MSQPIEGTLRSIEVMGSTLYVGTTLRSNHNACKNRVCSEDYLVKIICISTYEGIGLRSDKPIISWGDLGGITPSYQGYWATPDCIYTNFDIIREEMVVHHNIQYKNRNLNGMKCTLLKNIDINHTRHSFIELEENVGGGSADGLGKIGYCVPVPTTSLTKVTKKLKLKEKEV